MEEKISENSDDSGKGFKLAKVICKCWNRLLERKDWMCDPEGPAFFQSLVGFIFRLLGIGLILLGFYVIYLGLSSPGQPQIYEFLFGNNLRYTASASLFVGITFYIIGRHRKRTERQTAVYNEDIDALVSEVRSRMHLFPDDERREEAKDQILVLEKFRNKPPEVSIKRLLPLKRLIVTTYGNMNKLREIVFSDLHEYRFYVGDDYHEYIRYKHRIAKLIEEFECKGGLDELRLSEVRAELQEISKSLREEVISEKFLSGIGESLFESITHWAIVAVPALFLSGVSPLIEEPVLSGELSFINWGLLGMSGAALFTVAILRQRDASLVGADEGNMELRKMLLSMILGAVTAVMFFMAIKGGWFGGKALPKLNDDYGGPPQSQEVLNALSVIWAVAAGYSAKFLNTLVGASERASTNP